MFETINKLKYWYIFASKVWLSMLFGWLAVIIGFTQYLRLDRAGALLICGVLTAEIFNKNGYRRFIDNVRPGLQTQYIYTEADDPNKESKNIEITSHQTKSGKIIVNTDTWTIYHLAKPSEFFPKVGNRQWRIEETMKRLENRVEHILAFSAIVGTVLWAFF